MLKLKELEISQFGPIESFKMKLDGQAGTYSISAPNGSGKSHVVAALRALLIPHTGMQRPLGTYCRTVNGQIHKATISATLDVNGDDLLVTRTITPGREQDIAGICAAGGVPKATSTATAEYRGNKYKGVKGAESVDDLLADVVGIRNEAQAQAVFVLQNQAGDIWRLEDAARIRMFQSLSGAEVMEKLHKAATQKLDFFVTTDYTSQLDVAEKDVVRLHQEVKALEEKLVGLIIPDPAVHAENQRKLAAHESAVKAEQSLAASRQELQTALYSLSQAEANMQGLVAARDQNKYTEENANACTTEINSLTSEIARAESLADAYATRNTRLTNLRGQIEHLQTEQLASLFTDELPDVLGDKLEAAKAEIAAVILNGKTVRAFLDTYAEKRCCPTCGSNGICPSCGHVTMDIAGTVEAKTKERDVLGQEYKRVSAIIADLTPRHAASVEYQRKFLERETKLRQAQESLAQMEQEPMPVVASPEVVAGYRAKRDALEKTLRGYNDWKRAFDRAEREMHDRRKDVDVLNAKLSNDNAGGKMEPGEVAACHEQIRLFSERGKERAEAEGALKAYKSQLEEASRRVEELGKKKAENDKTAAARAMLQEIRTATHPGGIPRETAAAYLEDVNVHLGVYCRELRLPWTLYVEPEKMVLMMQSDTIHAPFKFHASGGMFTMASWAWSLTMNAIHGRSFGLLVIDEMTNGLDTENVEVVAGVMETMGEYCKNSGLQFIMVSHDLLLANSADHVIKLGEADDSEPAADAGKSKPRRTRRKAG